MFLNYQISEAYEYIYFNKCYDFFGRPYYVGNPDIPKYLKLRGYDMCITYGPEKNIN